MFANSSIHERRTAASTMRAMVDLARNVAMARRREVILAFASPEEIPGHGQALRMGIFFCEDRSPTGGVAYLAEQGEIRCRAMQRWRNLQAGVVLMPGGVMAGGGVNPMDGAGMRLRYGRGFLRTARVHGLVFGPDGGLVWPEGEGPAVLRLVAGGYERGRPVASRKQDVGRAPETVLQVGRGIARAFEAVR